MSGSAPSIRPARLAERLDAFAAIGATAEGGVDRQALTAGDRTARALLRRLAEARGFEVWQDDIANLFVSRAGRAAGLPPLLVGSHLDTQPTGGRFDGVLGVLSAFEALEAMEDAGAETERGIVLVAWTNEEGSRFAPGAMGSRAFAERRLAAEWLEARAADGSRLADELAATLSAFGSPPRPIGFPVSAYLELHIEQGPVLEQAEVPIGVVEGVQGVRWFEVRLTGQPAHAGTTPREFRHDPMTAAVEAIARLQRDVMPRDGEARFTVGRLGAVPGSINVIPGEVTFSIDIRHPSADRLDGLEGDIRRETAEAARRAGVEVEIDRVLDMAPRAFDAALLAALEAAAARTGHATRRLRSGAFHDALFIAAVAPAAMLFVPSRGGLSHNAAEFTAFEHVEAGAVVLLEAVAGLSGPMPRAGR